jgi:hypothetical protein
MAQPVRPKHAVGPGLGRIFWLDRSNGLGYAGKNKDLLKARPDSPMIF